MILNTRQLTLLIENVLLDDNHKDIRSISVSYDRDATLIVKAKNGSEFEVRVVQTK
jgi:hypothetical protein